MAKNFITNFRGENSFASNLQLKEEPVSPASEDFGDHNHLDYSFENNYGTMRKSLSLNDIAALTENFVHLGVQHDIKHEVFQKYSKYAEAPQELSKTKFVSMAEAIYHFERDTPGRFHSTRPRLFQPQASYKPLGLTKPQSPILRSKTRSRRIYAISQKEKEELELEEIKNYKIKANPIPKSVIEGSNLPDVPKKPTTVPEPFKITEVHKKSSPSPHQIQKFKARPAPKHILEKPQVPLKPPVHVTIPISPKLHYKKPELAGNIKENKLHCDAPKMKVKPVRHGPTRPEPFSFLKRDEDMLRQHEKKIKQQIEEERKLASQFKAQPLPGVVKKRMQSATVKESSSTTSSENKENHFKFEARPAVVLHKEPFKPVHIPLQLAKPEPFELTTEKRAAERQKFEQHLKEKEEEQERLRLLKEKQQREAEEKVKAEMRVKLVHHAKPAPATHPFIPEKSAVPLTVPETPKFVRRLKQN